MAKLSDAGISCSLCLKWFWALSNTTKIVVNLNSTGSGSNFNCFSEGDEVSDPPVGRIAVMNEPFELTRKYII